MRRRRGRKTVYHKITLGENDCNPPPPPRWIELPMDVTANILRRLGPGDILENAQRVCTTWRSVCREPSLWRVIDLKNRDVKRDPDTLCRLAVDRSQGELLDISIEDFADDDLLCYICDGSSLLKRLRLWSCQSISGLGLTSAVKNLSELEELQLIFMWQITASDIETISISCPKLKSFTFNDQWIGFHPEETADSYAMAIAKGMPNLCHLQLIGNKLTEKGLEAILNGCPCLESLDLRECFKISFHGDLEERCVNRIKDVKRPSDWTADYELGYYATDHHGYCKSCNGIFSGDDISSCRDSEDYFEDYEGYSDYEDFYENY